MRPAVHATGDPGLQPQRTVLAWNRTIVVAIANVLLALRAAFMAQAWTLAIVSLVLLFASALLLAVGSRRRRELIDAGATTAASADAVAAVALIALLACALGMSATLALALH